jgi:hypothetical protein
MILSAAAPARGSSTTPKKRVGADAKRLTRISALPANSSPTVLSVWPKTIVHDLRQQGRNVEKVLGEAGLDLRTVNREGGRIPWLGQAKLGDRSP